MQPPPEQSGGNSGAGGAGHAGIVHEVVVVSYWVPVWSKGSVGLQLAPPPQGRGLVQVRVRVWVPVPQVTLQPDEDQEDQPPAEK